MASVRNTQEVTDTPVGSATVAAIVINTTVPLASLLSGPDHAGGITASHTPPEPDHLGLIIGIAGGVVGPVLIIGIDYDFIAPLSTANPPFIW
jgi:hypothetical protein